MERDCGDESADGAVTMLFGAVGVDSLLAIFCFLLGIFAFCFFSVILSATAMVIC